MSKESISQQLFEHKNIKTNYQKASSSRDPHSFRIDDDINRFEMSLEDSHHPESAIHTEIPHFNTMTTETFAGGDQLKAALNDGSTVFQQAFSNHQNNEEFDHIERVPKLPYDTNFVLPQVTSASLIQDGQDIVNYLKENRYNSDLERRDQTFDVNSLVLEFEEAVKENDKDRVAEAVSRLQQVWNHLSL